MHNQVYITKTERYLSDVGNNVQKNKLIPKNSLIVSCIATVGLISINSEDSHTNQQINSIVCDEKNLYYLYFILKNMKETLIMYGSSGTEIEVCHA
jgi:type I restriction enzyme S subunit